MFSNTSFYFQCLFHFRVWRWSRQLWFLFSVMNAAVSGDELRGMSRMTLYPDNNRGANSQPPLSLPKLGNCFTFMNFAQWEEVGVIAAGITDTLCNQTDVQMSGLLSYDTSNHLVSPQQTFKQMFIHCEVLTRPIFQWWWRPAGWQGGSSTATWRPPAEENPQRREGLRSGRQDKTIIFL